MTAPLLSDIPLEILGVRMMATMFIVVAVSWAVGAFGPLVGGALAGLPIIIGPGFYFLAGQADAPFVAQTAAYTLLSLSGAQVFLLAYVARAKRGGAWSSLACAAGAWLLAALTFRMLPPQPLAGVLLFVAVTAACWHLARRFATPAPPMAGKPGWGLLIARGLLAGVLVATATTLSHRLGPRGSGLLLGFPIGFAMIAVTVQQKYGSASVIATLRSALFGTASVAAFCAVLAVAVRYLPPGAALALALLASVVITLGLLFRRRFTRR